jgi:hypothetical protein
MCNIHIYGFNVITERHTLKHLDVVTNSIQETCVVDVYMRILLFIVRIATVANFI